MEKYRRAASGPDTSPATDGQHPRDRLAASARLARLLDELEKLGIPSHPSLLRVGEGPPAQSLSRRIREASAAQMLAILSRQPAGLIAAVLRLESWPWEASFLAQLDSALRERVNAAMLADFRISEKLAGTLRSVLEARLGAVPARRERRGRLRKLLSALLERWLR